jgi:hypothetical protein
MVLSEIYRIGMDQYLGISQLPGWCTASPCQFSLHRSSQGEDCLNCYLRSLASNSLSQLEDYFEAMEMQFQE